MSFKASNSLEPSLSPSSLLLYLNYPLPFCLLSLIFPWISSLPILFPTCLRGWNRWPSLFSRATPSYIVIGPFPFHPSGICSYNFSFSCNSLFFLCSFVSYKNSFIKSSLLVNHEGWTFTTLYSWCILKILSRIMKGQKLYLTWKLSS